jgi:tripartite-type tricarboxylate transporter receptor subunit TctC
VTYGAEGSAEVVAGALRGDADFIVYGSTDLVGYVESGDIRPILFLGTEEQRPEEFKWLANVPGAEEAGYPDLAGTVTELRTIVAPPELPEPVAEFWKTTLMEAMTSDAFAEWAEQAQRPIVPRNAEEATDAVQAQIERMQTLVPKLTG